MLGRARGAGGHHIHINKICCGFLCTEVRSCDDGAQYCDRPGSSLSNNYKGATDYRVAGGGGWGLEGTGCIYNWRCHFISLVTSDNFFIKKEGAGRLYEYCNIRTASYTNFHYLLLKYLAFQVNSY
jgi:hypothetical protein